MVVRVREPLCGGRGDWLLGDFCELFFRFVCDMAYWVLCLGVKCDRL